MFKKVLIANRGDVAARVIRTLRTLGIRSVAVYSDADVGAPWLQAADEAYRIGEAPALASYLNQDALLRAIRLSGADGVHPGYGFLAENAAFAMRVVQAGAAFIGPSPRWIEMMAHKQRAREIMQAHGMPIGAGSGVLDGDAGRSREEARKIGYPVLIKPAGGGGGIGMLPVYAEEELEKQLERARSLASKAFADGDVYLEKYLERPRHIEFQLLGDARGAVCHLFERDCSVQRRHQKVIEEAHAPNMERGELNAMADRVAEVLRGIGYDNIGTVEMLRGADGTFRFLEMNTRLQVEHAVTEEITGIDLVAAQIKSAAGLPLGEIIPGPVAARGHAIEVRIYAEDPVRFLPSPGKLELFRPPHAERVRVETGYAEGMSVTPYYDPMVAKVIVQGETRAACIERMAEALRQFEVRGIKTNISFLLRMLESELFRCGDVHTGLVQELLAVKQERSS
ncbi:acetyl-CoA carboxylase biotin carboxylase subunit [Paenibacillus cymbidii]|uniref:acetyl-CoA carboxylase biotin carboxylase subunit n=1 Tax=Paenibacillus cymbidii TaxID=1639034 RepID=UPI001081491E|nr:biotin carboxylase N-terminal domain-containing protein [Paenibacillus cymbidii]